MKKKKRLNRRLLSVLLSFAMCLGVFPASVFAEDSPQDESKAEGETDVESVEYFNVESKHFEDSTRLFIQELLSAEDEKLNGGSGSTAALWQYLGYAVQKSVGQGTSDSKFKKQFGQVLEDGLALSTDSLSECSKDDVSDDDNEYNVRSTGLEYASSVASAAQTMENQIFSDYREAGGGRDDQYSGSGKTDEDVAVKHNSELAALNSEGDTFWMLTGAYKTSGVNKKGHYQALGVIFSDFTISPVIPEYDEETFQTEVSVEPATDGQSKLSDIKNETSASVSATQGLDTTYTTTLTSQISGSESYTYGGTVTVGTGVTIPAGPVMVNIHVSATGSFSNAIEEGWSESESVTEQTSEHSDITVTLPPYTNVLLEQTESELTSTTKYDCKVALNFDVTFVEYTLDPSSNNAKCATKILTSFGSPAREDLYQRGVVEKSLTDGSLISWKKLYEDDKDLEAKVKSIAMTVPSCEEGATFDITQESLSSKVDGLIATHPLDRVALTEPMNVINLMPGISYYVNNIGLTGYNEENGLYYGFNKLKGEWVLVDEEGRETKDSSVAKLVKDPVSNFTRLEPGTEDGKVYLKYKIDEDCYTSAEDQTKYATNESLSRTAVVEVYVTGTHEALQGASIYVDGELSGITGDEPKSIEGSDGLNVRMEDSTGKEISYPVEWEAKEMSGVTVEAGMISFSRPGTYHVRALCGDVMSDWVEVTALPARTADSILIPENYEMYVSAGNMMDLNTVQVQIFDQYGDPMDTDSEITWTCESGGAYVDENNILTVPSAGTYLLRASAGGISSNSMKVTVLDDTVKAMRWIFENGITTSGSAENFNGTDVSAAVHRP